MKKKTPAQLRASRNYNQKNRELINQKSREYALANAEKVKEAKRISKAKNKEKNREPERKRSRYYYYTHREEILKRMKKERRKNGIQKRKSKREERINMFGRRKKTDALALPVAPVQESPDLIVHSEPQHIGMPGFVADQPVAPVAPVPAPAPQPALPQVAPVQAPAPALPAPVVQPVAPVAPVAPAPAPVPEVKDWYTVAATEALEDGTFRSVLITSKQLGDVGGTYDL